MSTARRNFREDADVIVIDSDDDELSSRPAEVSLNFSPLLLTQQRFLSNVVSHSSITHLQAAPSSRQATASKLTGTL